MYLRMAASSRILLAGKGRTRLGHAVIVLKPVRQEQRAAALLLGVFDQRNGRRLVRYGVERPDQILAGTAQCRRASASDGEAMLFGASGRMALVRGGNEPAAGRQVELEFAGRAHHQG